MGQGIDVAQFGEGIREVVPEVTLLAVDGPFRALEAMSAAMIAHNERRVAVRSGEVEAIIVATGTGP